MLPIGMFLEREPPERWLAVPAPARAQWGKAGWGGGLSQPGGPPLSKDRNPGRVRMGVGGMLLCPIRAEPTTLPQPQLSLGPARVFVVFFRAGTWLARWEPSRSRPSFTRAQPSFSCQDGKFPRGTRGSRTFFCTLHRLKRGRLQSGHEVGCAQYGRRGLEACLNPGPYPHPAQPHGAPDLAHMWVLLCDDLR